MHATAAVVRAAGAYQQQLLRQQHFTSQNLTNQVATSPSAVAFTSTSTLALGRIPRSVRLPDWAVAAAVALPILMASIALYATSGDPRLADEGAGLHHGALKRNEAITPPLPESAGLLSLLPPATDVSEATPVVATVTPPSDLSAVTGKGSTAGSQLVNARPGPGEWFGRGSGQCTVTEREPFVSQQLAAGLALHPLARHVPLNAAGGDKRSSANDDAGRDQELFGVRLANVAEQQLNDLVIYTDRYVSISFPMGDVSPMFGVCTDVIVRAYRALGIDLQSRIYEARAGRGDRNIDHRRTSIVRRFLAAYGQTLPVTDIAEDYQPGDIVTYDRPQNAGSQAHIAIVSRFLAPSGRPMIIHNRGWGPQLEDALFVDEITGHYRYDGVKRVMVEGDTSAMPEFIRLRRRAARQSRTRRKRQQAKPMIRGRVTLKPKAIRRADQFGKKIPAR